jgi:hypothetical protein
MSFPELLLQAIGRSEIPLRFEPGADEAVAAPVTDLIRIWLLSHAPTSSNSEFDDGRKTLIEQLIEELAGLREVPGQPPK